MEQIALKDLLDLGSNGVLAYVVFRLYDRLNAVTDRLFAYLERASDERQAIAQANGLNTQDLSDAAAEVRQRRLEQGH